MQLVDDLFRLAEKYMVNGIYARLKHIFMSPSFLRDHPIWVYTLACRANLDADAELVIPLTFTMDLVRDIPRTCLSMMTGETYNRLLAAHATRRDALISAANRAVAPAYPGKCSCGLGFYTRLGRDIRLAVWEKPFLDRQRLDSCLPDSKSVCKSKSACRVSEQVISRYFTDILGEVQKLG